MHRWTGCMLALARFYGVLMMPVIVSTSLSMADYAPSQKTTREWSKLLQSMAKGILLAKLMSSQALLGATRYMLFELQSSFGCRRRFSTPYHHGKYLLNSNQDMFHHTVHTRNPQTTAL